MTLAELVVSSAVTAVLAGGMASAVVLASRALPENQAALDGVVRAADAAEMISADLLCATAITENEAAALTMTVADRNSDGSDETIRYAWSGTTGDPLTRACNGGTAATVLDDVRDFVLAYRYLQRTEEVEGDPIQSTESTLRSFDASSGLSEFVISSSSGCGQYFKPSLPTNALSWSITRVWVVLWYEGALNGRVAVQIRAAEAGGLPASGTLAEQTIAESDLNKPYYDWYPFTMTGVTDLTPDAGVCLTLVRGGGSGNSGRTLYRASGVSAANSGWLVYNGSWTIATDKALLYYVYGTYKTPGPPETVTHQFVSGVQIGLQAGDSGDANRLTASIPVLNTPEVTP